MAVTLAILLAVMLAAIGHVLEIYQSIGRMPIPMPVPTVEAQVFQAILWLCVAVFISITVFGATVLLVSKIRSRKMSKEQID